MLATNYVDVVFKEQRSEAKLGPSSRAELVRSFPNALFCLFFECSQIHDCLLSVYLQTGCTPAQLMLLLEA